MPSSTQKGIETGKPEQSKLDELLLAADELLLAADELLLAADELLLAADELLLDSGTFTHLHVEQSGM